MKVAVLVITLLALSVLALEVAQTYKDPRIYTFEEFKRIFKKSYSRMDENGFRATYDKNLARILKHNARTGITYKLGINEFADFEENDIYKNTHPINISFHQLIYKAFDKVVYKPSAELAPIDWVARGKVTSIKRQGICGGCYAFASLAALESAILIAGGNSTNLSEQQVIDCSKMNGNMGCQSGTLTRTFQYLKANPIVTERDYPYTSDPDYYNMNRIYGEKGCIKYNQTIRRNNFYFKLNGSEYKMKNYVNITPYDCTELEKALQISPVFVMVSIENWAFYDSGIFADCTIYGLRHAVLLVGATKDYWKIKNSWGEGWGEDGYIRLARGNTCGICTQAAYPIYKK